MKQYKIILTACRITINSKLLCKCSNDKNTYYSCDDDLSSFFHCDKEILNKYRKIDNIVFDINNKMEASL